MEKLEEVDDHPVSGSPQRPPERLVVLDILRGFAILGMFIVHFVELNPNPAGTDSLDLVISHAISGLVTNKSRWLFCLLFGVGFAIQLRRAAARGEEGQWRFLRRLVGVAGFGVLTGVLVGFTDLINYSCAGVWLLLIRRWSTRALLAALAIGTTLIGMWNVALGSYQWATLGAARANAIYASEPLASPARQEALSNLRAAEQGTSFLRLKTARLVWVYRGPRLDLWGDWSRGEPGLALDSLSSALSIFLVGLLALRLGMFDRPHDHRRALMVVMLVGAALWAGERLVRWPDADAMASRRMADSLRSGLGLFDDGYLALTYAAAITLLVAASRTWEHRLQAVFGAAGQMALTNYILQFAVISVLFDGYGFAIKWLTRSHAPLAGLFLFAVLAGFSRWWLARFRFGPAEWILRSLTYARLQPFLRPAAAVRASA